MNLAEHPTVVAAAKRTGVDVSDPAHAEAFAGALQIGVKQERERVCAHLRLAGGATGGLALAVSLIEAGEPMTPSTLAGYVECTRHALDLAAWYEDGEVVDAAIEDVARPPSSFTNSLATATYHELRRLLGRDEVDDTAIEDLEDA